MLEMCPIVGEARITGKSKKLSIDRPKVSHTDYWPLPHFMPGLLVFHFSQM